MPCYTDIPTLLMRLDALRMAADALGIDMREVSVTNVVLTKDGITLTLGRGNETAKFSVQTSYSSTNYDELLDPLYVKYAESVIQKFADINGYTVSRKSSNQLQLVSFN